jgi:toxin-antitoxin system PIN domain toxin
VTYLLDVNVLIALIDPQHVASDAAHKWFERIGRKSWATCPITENGTIRILGNMRYSASPGTPAAIADFLKELRNLPGHQFWQDDLSIVDHADIDTSRLLTWRQVTDTYLLALAASKNGQLATFDRKLIVNAVRGGTDALHLIGD